MKKVIYYCSWAFILSFTFVAGVGSTGSLWGGAVALALIGALYGIVLCGN